MIAIKFPTQMKLKQMFLNKFFLLLLRLSIWVIKKSLFFVPLGEN